MQLLKELLQEATRKISGDDVIIALQKFTGNPHFGFDGDASEEDESEFDFGDLHSDPEVKKNLPYTSGKMFFDAWHSEDDDPPQFFIEMVGNKLSVISVHDDTINWTFDLTGKTASKVAKDIRQKFVEYFKKKLEG
jgi:hypothetical protein